MNVAVAIQRRNHKEVNMNLCIWKKSCTYKHGHRPCPPDCKDFINKKHLDEELARIEKEKPNEKIVRRVPSR